MAWGRGGRCQPFAHGALEHCLASGRDQAGMHLHQRRRPPSSHMDATRGWQGQFGMCLAAHPAGHAALRDADPQPCHRRACCGCLYSCSHERRGHLGRDGGAQPDVDVGPCAVEGQAPPRQPTRRQNILQPAQRIRLGDLKAWALCVQSGPASPLSGDLMPPQMHRRLSVDRRCHGRHNFTMPPLTRQANTLAARPPWPEPKALSDTSRSIQLDDARELARTKP